MAKKLLSDKLGAFKGKIPKVGIMSEFREFLEEYKIIGLAIAFIIGAAATTFVKALVDYIIITPK